MALLSVIRRWHYREGMPIREITRRTGLSRNEIAATLQYFTFPLEVVGLTLAVIEIRFPSSARKIEAVITSYGSFHSSRNEKKQIEDQQAGEVYGRTISKMFGLDVSRYGGVTRQVIMSIGGMLTAFALVTIFFSLKGGISGEWLMNHPSIVQAIFALTGVAMIGFGLYSSSDVLSRFAVSFVEGRAVGTLGIIIAGFGVLGEAYQFTTQLVV